MCLLIAYSNLGLCQSGISIIDVDGGFKQDVYEITARLDYSLSDNAIEALQHGVSLNFIVRVDFFRKRQWVWDKHIERLNLNYQLDYHPLSERYLVIDMTSNKSEDFSSLSAALRYLGSIKTRTNMSNEVFNNETHYLSLRAVLDVRSLPIPLQALTLFSSDWNLKSPVTKKTLGQGNDSDKSERLQQPS